MHLTGGVLANTPGLCWFHLVPSVSSVCWDKVWTYTQHRVWTSPSVTWMFEESVLWASLDFSSHAHQFPSSQSRRSDDVPNKNYWYSCAAHGTVGKKNKQTLAGRAGSETRLCALAGLFVFGNNRHFCCRGRLLEGLVASCTGPRSSHSSAQLLPLSAGLALSNSAIKGRCGHIS